MRFLEGKAAETPLTYSIIEDDFLVGSDVSRNTALKELWCSYNSLTSLDVSKNTELEVLSFSGSANGNQRIASLNVSNNTKLRSIFCGGNQFSVSALNALFETLHSNSGYKTIYIRDNPGTNGCNQSIATAKGWVVNVNL